MSIQAIIEGVIGREGRYSNNPHDTGGETMWGITIGTARASGYTGPMRDMPRDVAAQIYLNQYVTKPGFLKVAAKSLLIAEEMVDSAVNCGPSAPIKWLQRTLNALNQQGNLFPDLLVDGELGPATHTALAYVLNSRKADGEKIIVRSLNCQQGVYYLEITERREANEDFFAGWMLNRVAAA